MMLRIILSISLILGLVVLPVMIVHATDTRSNYYLYEESQLSFSKCLRYEALESHAPLRLSSVINVCKVFHFRPDGTIQATVSTTAPNPTEWCLDAASGLGNDGDLIQLFECNSKPNQIWHLIDGRLRGIHDKCIVRGEGDKAILGSCEHGIMWHPEVWTQD